MHKLHFNDGHKLHHHDIETFVILMFISVMTILKFHYDRFLVIQLQWRNSYYRTFYGPILRFLITFYSVYEVKCDQKVEYGTIIYSIVRISPVVKMGWNGSGVESFLDL